MRRRIVSLILGVLMVAALAGCNGSKNNTTDITVTPTGSESGNSNAQGNGEGANLLHVCGGEVVLCDLSVLTMPEDTGEVSEEDIEAEYQDAIESLLVSYPNYVKDESRDGTPIVSGDTVNIDYVGKLDGVAFDGGTDTDYDLTIGSGTFIEDFENGLIGKTVGTTVDISTRFPEDYTSVDLAGKTTVFTITINYVGKQSETADDDYINRLSEGAYKTLEAYREAIKADMIAEAKEKYENEVFDSILKQMVDNSEFKSVLQEDIDYFENDMIEYYKSYAQYYGGELENVVSMFGYETYDEFLKYVHTSSERYVKEYMVLQEIAKLESLTPSEEEYVKRVNDYMASSSFGSVAEFEEYYSKEYLNYCIENDLAMEFLVDRAKQNSVQ